MEVQE